MNFIFKAIAILAFLLLGLPACAQEPDKKFASVGDWEVSTARFGVGCVAQLNYDDENLITVGGETLSKLNLLITVSAKIFSTTLSSAAPIPQIEIALVDHRWGNVLPYGYRGTSGVVLHVDPQFLDSFAASKVLKVTEVATRSFLLN